tara:strand:- start:1890 stop:2249 length:360 start_codon:yes stop_codon:yes gene_type:complete
MKEKEIGGWGKECEWQCSYENDNYYLLIWDDPNEMEIRTTAQVREALEASFSEEDSSPWLMRSRSFVGRPIDRESSDVDELMNWLNEKQDWAERVPSDNFICDDCGYVWIRRILPKFEE